MTNSYKMPENMHPDHQRNRRKTYYGWVIVAVCALMMAITYGLMFSYSVFFKPISEYFKWDRATVSAVYSISLVIRGAVAIGIGWLADKYGPAKIMVFCGFMLGLGLVLSGHITNLWQFYLTYGLIEAIGLSGSFGVGTAIVSRWFNTKRGLALGVVSTGSGLGTLFIVPTIERIITTYGWSQTFIYSGIVSGAVMMAMALFLRNAPAKGKPNDGKTDSGIKAVNNPAAITSEVSLGSAIKDSRMILFMGAVLLFFFSIQIVMVHLVSFATDMDISPLVAASFISVIGAVSIPGRLFTGMWTDKTGIFNTLIFTRISLVAAFICLVFASPLWSFYLFAVIFGLPYGGEIPQIPLFVGKYWGTKSMATLVGLNTFVITIGGALGSWGAGEIFDITHHYQGAFIAGAVAGLLSLILIWMLKRQTSEIRGEFS